MQAGGGGDDEQGEKGDGGGFLDSDPDPHDGTLGDSEGGFAFLPKPSFRIRWRGQSPRSKRPIGRSAIVNSEGGSAPLPMPPPTSRRRGQRPRSKRSIGRSAIVRGLHAWCPRQASR